MSKNYLSLLILATLSLLSANTFAQDGLTFGNGKTYLLEELKVTGVVTYNEQTIITYTGLIPGQPITIPGVKLSDITKRLWGLGLFSNVNFYLTKVEGDKAWLELEIQELPELSEVKFVGMKKSKTKELIKEASLNKGIKVTENLITNTKNYLENKYKKKGYLNTKTVINTLPDTVGKNSEKMVIRIDKGDKVKIRKIILEGNEKISDYRLKKTLKKTKQVKVYRLFKRSKYIEDDYHKDLQSLVDKYKERGFRDARILSDTLIKVSKKRINLLIKLEEGNKFYFGNINFVGNSVFSEIDLKNALGINKGDVYNGVLFKKRIKDDSKPDSDDLSNLYQNNGYLFSNLTPVEVGVRNDTIDFEIRVVEGKLAHFNEIRVNGNTRTNDHVIYRELRTRPGQVYSKANLLRSIRELGQTGFFDPEQIDPKFENVKPDEGILDINYSLVEKGSSQIELQGGFGGGGFIGTLGLSFNNFSIRNILKKEEYKPLPMGDGQSLALRLQASRTSRVFSFSFVEPWLGGKKPVQFSTTLSHSKQFLFNGIRNDVDKSRSFTIDGITLGLAKRLKVPDDFFTLSQAVSFQFFNLNNFNTGLFTFGDGVSNNFAYTIAISRNDTRVNPIFPVAGSSFNLSLKVTPPYSLLSGTDYGNLKNLPGFQNADGTPNQSLIDQKRFRFLEFYKIKFKGEWYNSLYANKLVLKTNAELGYLGSYNSERGTPPFERFFLGGDGLGNFSLDGRETIGLRGYPNQSLSSFDGGTIYNKFSLELRYPLTLGQAASIYTLGFLEGGASFEKFRDYNPFDLNRSAGFGIRIFMPAFGLLGIDFGYGFDNLPGSLKANGWETHFIIGQQF
ncbi:MAG: outer membrane protein assembly factor BamA [Flavobacteriales bacterium CG_4_9_14_3_um_filter_40_17]|nr:MAG: outer membrane protein assembly factor BamA [Flavobacteriales bacterium CG_4_9_14_3_um_filter_40_17]